MATRARIGIENDDRTVTSVYLHHDGYVDGAGDTLRASYTTRDAVAALLELGDLSTLDADPDHCLAFGRDNGEVGTDAMRHAMKDWPDSNAMYYYLYRQDGRWWMSENARTWAPLEAVEILG